MYLFQLFLFIYFICLFFDHTVMRKIEKWKSDKDMDVASEVDTEVSEIETIIKAIEDPSSNIEGHPVPTLLELDDQLAIMVIQYDTMGIFYLRL